MRPGYNVVSVDTDPETLRWGARMVPGDVERYAMRSTVDGRAQSSGGVYISLPTTLEDEVNNGGWLHSSVPTGPKPRQLFTLGMRGEPGYDDDPTPDTTNSYQQGGSYTSGDGD